MKTAALLFLVVCVSSAFGQTLPDFSRAVLQPLTVKATEEEAQHKRATLARACASRETDALSLLLGFLDPKMKLAADALTVTPEQAHQFCALALTALKDQTASRIASRLADLELKTTAIQTPSGVIFSVCNEKTARQWKALAGGTYQPQGDVPC